MSKLYLISGILGDFGDISKNMIKTILNSNILFVEELDVFAFFIKKNNIPFKGEVFEIGINNDKYRKIILESILKGLNIGIFESSGIPCFVDPGLDILQFIYELKKKGIIINIIYIPGGSAVTAALSLSGFNIDKFSFLYFLSALSKNEILSSNIPIIYFVEHNRFNKLLDDISFMKGINDKKVFCGFNIAKRMAFGDILIRDTYDKSYFQIEKLHKECLTKGEIPDIVFVFDN